MLAALAQEIGSLKALGFTIWEAILILVIVFIFGFLWAQIRKERTRHDRVLAQLDTDRRAARLAIEKRLQRTEKRSDECEEDREQLHLKISGLETKVARYTNCHKSDCPMRLPG